MKITIVLALITSSLASSAYALEACRVTSWYGLIGMSQCSNPNDELGDGSEKFSQYVHSTNNEIIRRMGSKGYSLSAIEPDSSHPDDSFVLQFDKTNKKVSDVCTVWNWYGSTAYSTCTDSSEVPQSGVPISITNKNLVNKGYELKSTISESKNPGSSFQIYTR